MSDTPHSSSVALVQAKIEQNIRDRAETARQFKEKQQSDYLAYVEFWKPIISEISKVAAAYPRVRIFEPGVGLTSGYRICIGSNNYTLARYTEGCVGIEGRPSSKFDSQPELLTALLELIAKQLS